MSVRNHSAPARFDPDRTCFCSSLEVLRAARAVAPDVVIYNGDLDYRSCAAGDPQEFIDLFDSLFGAPPALSHLALSRLALSH